MPDPTDVMVKTVQTVPSFCLPALPYQPTNPKSYNPAIGVIGCGGITTHHLRAYVAAGYRVTALCDVVQEAAERRRDEFYPEAAVFTDYREMLEKTSRWSTSPLIPRFAGRSLPRAWKQANMC